jgi:hypothetical protein
MRHELLQLHLSEWMTDKLTENPADKRSFKRAVIEFINFMVARDWLSVELELSKFLQSIVGHGPDQSSMIDTSPVIFTSCLLKPQGMVFVDTARIASKEEPNTAESYVLELDIFGRDDAWVSGLKDSLVEEVMKCFGLTKSKEALIYRDQSQPYSRLRERLKTSPAISDALFEQLRDAEDREILRELKKRGAILERDIHELQLPMSPDRITRVLDYFSGEEFQLVERKYAIVCRDTNEIIFLLQSQDQIESAAPLQCPKCARQIDTETVMPYYGITESLKALLDGNRWMPLIVRDALIRAGVPGEDILTEVKHSEDEIDVFVFYRGRFLVIELKNRPVNLNDAYKLSAKTSRLESVISKAGESFALMAARAYARAGTWNA